HPCPLGILRPELPRLRTARLPHCPLQAILRQVLVLRTVRKSVGWKWWVPAAGGVGLKKRNSASLPRSAAGIVDRAPPWHFDVAVVYLAPHLSLRDICGGAAPPAISQRDSDHVFEHKLLSLRRALMTELTRGGTCP